MPRRGEQAGGACESIVRRSVPPSNKCVANEWRNAWVVARLSIIASSTAWPEPPRLRRNAKSAGEIVDQTLDAILENGRCGN